MKVRSIQMHLRSFQGVVGSINSDVTQGVDLSRCNSLLAKSWDFRARHGSSWDWFYRDPHEAEHLRFGKRPGLEQHIGEYRNGSNLMAHSRDAMVIDLFGLNAEGIRTFF